MSSSEFFLKHTIVTALLLVLLTSCGFQMRGARSVPAEMSSTYIETTDRHSLFYRRMRDSLRAASIELVESPVEASATFSIISDITGQRVLSVSTRNVPREFEVFYTVVYSLKTEKEFLLDPQTQTLTRVYNWDETQVLGKEKEEQLMREAIVDDLVRTILIQLSAL
jgi:LPS-assembly lipoprotein